MKGSEEATVIPLQVVRFIRVIKGGRAISLLRVQIIGIIRDIRVTRDTRVVRVIKFIRVIRVIGVTSCIRVLSAG